jgi:two-component SAPR family response regulator
LELNHEALRRMPWADHEGRGQALREQAELWIYLGNSIRAIQAMEESLAHTQHLGDPVVLAERTISQGVAYCISGRLTEAKRTLKRGLSMLESPDTFGVHIAHLHLGDGHFERWELERAIEHYQQSLAFSQRFQDSTSIVYGHCALGVVYTMREAFDQAQAHFDAALAILEQTGMSSLPAEATWSYLAEWHVKAGRYTEAEACSHKAIVIRSANAPNTESNGVWQAIRGDESGGLAWGMGWLPLAKVYLATDRRDEAEKILLDIEAASEAGGIAPSSIDSAFRLSLLYLETGRGEEATFHIRRALSAAAPEGHRWVFLALGGEAIPVLIQALKHKIEPAFAQTLLRELGEAAHPALTELLTEPDAEVRRYAQEAVPPEADQRLETATAVAPDETLSVTCFGDFRVTLNGEEVGESGWLATRAGHLFAYFITFRDSHVPRDRILEALWPEMRPDRSSGAFHTALYKLRQMLRSGRPGRFVRAQSGEYYLERDLFRIDADEFLMLNAHSSGHSHESIESCEPCIERLRRAVNLYQGDYLENLYYDWALDEQRRLQEMHLRALQVLAQHHGLRGDYEAAISYYRQILANDSLLEDIHCQVMRYYGQLGDRNGVMQQYRRLEQILADELGVEPMPETQELYRALMGGESR